MTLSDYIKKHGDNACAGLWNLKPRTVAGYRRGELDPSPEVARRIVQTTQGAVTFDAIYGQKAAA